MADSVNWLSQHLASYYTVEAEQTTLFSCTWGSEYYLGSINEMHLLEF